MSDFDKTLHAQLRHLIDDLTVAVHDEGRTLYVPKNTLMFSNFIAALDELERTHYTPADMADASAQGFRDGVASVTAGQGQEPVAWMYDWLPAGGPTAYDWISGSKAEVFAPENCYFNIRPLYAAPVVQQQTGENNGN